MNTRNGLPYLLLSITALCMAMCATVPGLIREARIGLEFSGGYEILYVAEPREKSVVLSHEVLVKTANLLRSRADTLGMAEPEISLESNNRIRLKIAGISSADQVRKILGNQSDAPVRLTEKYTQTVGSVLGQTALKETLWAGVWGLLSICALMILLYRAWGVLASLCLLVYLWMMLTTFHAMHATISLSAIVAFMLGIGMASDASIILFERLVEEHRRSLNWVDSFKIGFNSAFRTIRLATFVTAIAMLVLYLAGIGPILAFSLTMLMSMAISMVTNLFLVHVLCRWLTQSPLSDLLRYPFSSWNGRVSIGTDSKTWNFTGWGFYLVTLSVILIASGGWYYSKHGLNLDIDFTSGTALDLDLVNEIDQDTATKVMTDAGIVPATVSIGGEKNTHIAARFDEILKSDEITAIVTAFKSKYGTQVEFEENTADPAVAREFTIKAFYAIIAACVSIVIFMGFMLSWTVAFCVLISIIHDLLLVSAIFALFKLEIDVSYIAAMLTVMGYSLNDKIVIFDRIRENLNLKDVTDVRLVRQLVNFSIRQTLGRTIYTVLTVLMASACLYQFGCEPLQMFALAIFIGLISGAYSSIFLACPVWLLSKQIFARRTGTPVAIRL